MWALGVIVYIILTGVHPFDAMGHATDEDVETDICNPDLPLPLGTHHPFTLHLNPSAINLICQLMERYPEQRLLAFEMLHHPWVTGETASTAKMAGSDRRLHRYRRIKTRLQTQLFANAVGWSDKAIHPTYCLTNATHDCDASERTSDKPHRMIFQGHWRERDPHD
jgi:serine/threonine protein kinase